MIVPAKSNAVGLTCRQLSADDYHADPAIGSSMIEDFRHSRRYYQGRHITKTIPRGEPTPAKELGTCCHLRILEPARYFEILAEPYPELAPDGKKWLRREGSDHAMWWAEEVAKRAGKLAIDKQTREKVEAIAQSVLSKDWAKRLLVSGEPEFSIFWTDEETGLPLKCRVDWFRYVVHTDLKTTCDPHPAKFVRQCVSYGYHRKRAHYLAGIKAFTGERDPKLVNIAVGTDPPYSSGAYNIGDFDARINAHLGAVQRRYTLNAMARCYETGDFSDAWEREIMDLEFPAYAFTEDQYQL